MTIDIYTDGACSGNPGPGGWGAILCWNGHEKELSGGQAETTNNKMEMQAVIEALTALKKPSEVTIYTDSKYVKQGAEDWIHGWKKKNWQTAGKKPVKNKELWMQIDTLLQKHNVTFVLVKGHSGHEMNERVDQLAVAAVPK